MVFDLFFYCVTVTEYYYMAGSVSAKYEQNQDLRFRPVTVSAFCEKKNILMLH